MKKSGFLLLALVFACNSYTQTLTVLPSGGNKKASVSERIGLTDVTIHYDRPGVKGREGKIWGQLVPIGFTDPQFGSSKSSPWRAGANENTTIEFSNAVTIQGQRLAAGKYGFFIAYDPSGCTLIFSRNSTSWGHYYYDSKEDALRVQVNAQPLVTSVEWLKYEFLDETESGATIALQWEKLSIPFRVETDYVNDQLASFRNELRTDKGFMWESWQQAAAWCLQRKVNLEQALQWADSATSTNFGGDRSFQAWSTKAQILELLGRGDEALAVMQKATPFGSMNDLHQYGRQLLSLKKYKEAMSVFQANYSKYPNQFTTLMGMTRGYSANGDFTNALKYANLALPLAPANQAEAVKGFIEKLKQKKDINQ